MKDTRNVYFINFVRRLTRIIFVAGGLLFNAELIADTTPRWEAGVALAGQSVRDYRGSKSEQIQAYPVPFFLYRGKVLKSDRDGVRGEFFKSKKIELNASGEVALNGDSSENELREGMPELDSAFEFGPSFNINLSGESFSNGWQLRIPIRIVITAGEAGVHHRGYTFNPHFTFIQPKIFGDWRAVFNVGALYGSQSYHRYYYNVAERYETETRPAYRAGHGFSGYYSKASISRRKGNFWYGLSLRYDNLNGATFEDSSLVETDDFVAVSFAIGWVGWRSKQ